MKRIKKPDKVDLILGLLCIAIILWCIAYSLEDSRMRARLLRRVSIICQTCARIFGQTGIRAEQAYNRILETERMV